jgi:hypothetical protein
MGIFEDYAGRRLRHRAHTQLRQYVVMRTALDAFPPNQTARAAKV